MSTEPAQKIILLVEDDEMVRTVAAETLLFAGYDVIPSVNGQEALDILKRRKVDLILSDVRMPVCDGIKLLSLVKKEPLYREIPFIFVSAKVETSDLRKGMSLGADDYVTKPYNAEDLLLTIRARLDRAELWEMKAKHYYEFLTRVLPHELRTPLTGIMGFAELMSQTGGMNETLTSTELVEYGDIIQRSGNRLLKIANDFTLWSWLEACALGTADSSEPLNRVRITKQLMASGITRLSELYGRQGMLYLELEESEVLVPREGLVSVLEHLIENALKFSPSGTNVNVRGSVNGEIYEFTISDQGPGISEKNALSVGVMRQFEREQNEQQGMGMGLVIAYSFANLSGGKLTLESNPTEVGLVTRLCLRRPQVAPVVVLG
jgi:signal transduction histidine kinase